MGIFADLLKYESQSPGLIAEQQLRAAKEFPSVVAKSRLTYWHCGDPISDTGERFLVGVAASYNQFELGLLDQINEKLGAKALVPKPRRVDVFNVDDIQGSNLESYFPGLKVANNTPLAGVWRDGILLETGIASSALEILRTYFGVTLEVR